MNSLSRFEEFIEQNKVFKFSDDQITSAQEIFNFLSNDENIIGFYGFAGTGKTTIIMKIIMFLLMKKYVSVFACTALTNKAVNILKSKFMTEFDIASKSNTSFHDAMNKLLFDNIVLDFMTTHKLLGVARDFGVDGSIIFKMSGKCSIDKYELVIIDECSMISNDILQEIFKQLGNNKNAKIIFIGDPGQLPPVNEPTSILFNNKTIKTMTMKTIVRSNYSNIIGMSNEIRAWVFNEIKMPVLGKFRGPNVFMYKYTEGNGPKTKTEWFAKFIAETTYNKCHNAIILTWTNKQTDEYNKEARTIINKSSKLNTYEPGDILILNTFYNLKEDHDEKENKFYTSEQVRVRDADCITKVLEKFNENVTQTIPLSSNIRNKYISTIKKINKQIDASYSCYKLTVCKLNMGDYAETNDDKTIFILPESVQFAHQQVLNKIINEIRKLVDYYTVHHKSDIATIEVYLIRNFWSEFNRKYVDIFANVNYGYSTTVHKSQSSTYQNVFVDMDDMIKNKNESDMKRCLYTAITRASEKIFVLI